MDRAGALARIDLTLLAAKVGTSPSRRHLKVTDVVDLQVYVWSSGPQARR